MTDASVDWQLLDQRNEDSFVDSLSKAGVILKGHFVLRSMNHTDRFVDIKGLYPHTRVTKSFARALALRIQRELGDEQLLSVRGVVAPAVGGVILAHDTAEWIGLLSQEFDREVLALFAEKDENGVFYFGRGYDEYIAGGLFVIVEDVMTSGGSVHDLVELIEGLGGKVLIICAIWNRGQVTAERVRGITVISLINKVLESWTGKECIESRLCSRGIEINTKHGRGAAYVKEYGQPKIAS